MKYHLYIDSEKQEFVIKEVGKSPVIARREMPFRSVPNPGAEALMNKFENQKAYRLMSDLVMAANRGLI